MKNIIVIIFFCLSVSAFAESPKFSSIPKEKMKVEIIAEMFVRAAYYSKGHLTTSLGEGRGEVTCLLWGSTYDLFTISPGIYDVYEKSGILTSEAIDTQLIFNVPTPKGNRDYEQVHMICELYGQSGTAASKDLSVEQIENAIGSLRFNISP